MPQETKAKSGVPEEKPTLQGLVASREDAGALTDALEKAFDYRGDVTLTLTDGSSVQGYIFDRERGKSLTDSSVRIMRADTGAKVRVSFDRIGRVEFTGKDAAHGKTFEGWLKRYVEKKLAGEKASIESESLD